MTDPTATAQAVVDTWRASGSTQPILASWMGGAEVDEGEAILNQAGIPTYRYPDQAARLFGLLWRHSYALKGLYETPALTLHHGVDRAAVAAILHQAQAENQAILTETDSKSVLAAYGIPVVPTQIAVTAAGAIAAAEAIGYPVVLKLYSHTLTHKTDVGGVQLNLPDGEAVGRAFERIQTSVGEKPNSPRLSPSTSTRCWHPPMGCWRWMRG